MLAVLAYHHGDFQLAANLARWMKQLGGCQAHRLLLVRSQGAGSIPEFQDVFESVQELTVADPYRSWPLSPNWMFKTAAKHIQYTKPESWLWLEPDCVPIKSGWLDAIETEWRAARKHFLGDFVPGVQDSPDHMSGIGIYPGKLTNYAGKAVLAMEYPWDLEAADQIAAQAHFTDLIKHNWRPPEFNSREEMQAEIPSECVLYHKDKTGNLIRLLNGTDDAVTAGVEERRANFESEQVAKNVSALMTRSEFDLRMAEEIRKTDDPETRLCLDEDWRFNRDRFPETPGGDPIEPWAGRLQSEQEIKRLCAELKRYCTTPVYTGLVRRELAAAGVTPKIVKKRRKAK